MNECMDECFVIELYERVNVMQIDIRFSKAENIDNI